MTKAKPTHGGKRAGAGAPEGNTNGVGNKGGNGAPIGPRVPSKKLVSGRVELSIYEALQMRAKERGTTESFEVGAILAEVLGS